MMAMGEKKTEKTITPGDEQKLGLLVSSTHRIKAHDREVHRGPGRP